jgi:hypothetical protein
MEGYWFRFESDCAHHAELVSQLHYPNLPFAEDALYTLPGIGVYEQVAGRDDEKPPIGTV